MERIKEQHGLVQARAESAHADPMAAGVGTKLFRDGHRKGFWDGTQHTLLHLPSFAEYFDWRVFAGFTNGMVFARWLRNGDVVRLGHMEGSVEEFTEVPREGAVRFTVRTETGRAVKCTRPANTVIRVLSLGAVT